MLFHSLCCVQLCLVLLSCVLLQYSVGMFPPPTKGHTVFCYTVQCLLGSIKQTESYDPVYVGLVSYNFNSDSYLSLYLGTLIHLFDLPEYLFVFLVLQSPPGMSNYDAGLLMLQALPTEKSIFVCMEHGNSAFGINNLLQAAAIGYSPAVVYHINHERPWLTAATSVGEVLDYTFESIEYLRAVYELFPLVLRNYYYEPLLNVSQFVPVGAPFDGFVINNSTSPLSRSYLVPPSKRSKLCYFKGRTVYGSVYDRNDNLLNPKESIAGEQPSLLPQEKERALLLQLAESNSVGGCIIEAKESSPLSAGESYSGVYATYMEQLADTVFVPCPLGNNPETFRHYEALEVGAIPILITPKDAEQNFLKYPLWTTYPGPIVDSWNELESFLQSATWSELDQLQEKVWTWYDTFKVGTKATLSAALKTAFERSSKLKAEADLNRLQRNRQSPRTVSAESSLQGQPVPDNNLKFFDASSNDCTTVKVDDIGSHVNVDSSILSSILKRLQELEQASIETQHREELLLQRMDTLIQQQYYLSINKA